ncbi:SWIM zinc finger family protein [Microbispora sp. KK1-11]|uniref:SWIM zinc finger family protein n=1 Tax=Microbispora sp. KK1-11 TaxID=2053005 RepID=UPI0011589063|nr:SWIM zinc finger family protein [Microbispora sp. KK1-11]TQS25522.1 SWIM zinc finger family protein [Microbispora sp. KK1-11]
MADAVLAYSYVRSSGLDLSSGLLDLSTSGGVTPSGPAFHPAFFSGLLTRAAPAAAGLLGVADVARARYYDARPTGIVRDPVVTCNGDRLRFESFSACGGVYARLDVLQQALDGEVVELGTTNVDVNDPLRRALVRVGGNDPLHLRVGAEELVATTLEGPVVEKKVPLPTRWVRGFAEVQVIASGFDLRAELTGSEAVRFLRSLPRRGVLWAVPAGRSLRLSARPAAGAVCLPGPDRLATLLPLLRFATGLRVYGPAVPAHGLAVASAWELELPGMRYVLTLSPEPRRGFSGEGAVLDDLATAHAEEDADLVGAMLAFEPRLDADLLAERCGLPRDRIRAALTQLGTAGRVGYDVAEAAHFHRELPYDPGRVAAMNPRLKAARDLVKRGAVRFSTPDIAVVGERRVRLSPDGPVCTCPWYADFRGSRGPCKHVLAAQQVHDQAQADPKGGTR